MTLPGWAREPLVHFVALGALLYVALTWGGTPVDPASRVIKVGPEEQAQIALSFERTMGRAPTDAELDAAIERYVRDEVLYREALRLGLDQGDAVVRQRLVSKMDMSASIAAETAEPDEAVLEQWRAEHPERFAATARYSFDQIYFEREEDALAAITGAGPGEDWRSLGQPISLPSSVDDMSVTEIAARFGEAFVAGLRERDFSDSWGGPHASGFGWHLVRIRDYRQSDVPPLSAIREAVENDWRSAQIAERKNRAFDVLRSAYRVEIER